MSDRQESAGREGGTGFVLAPDPDDPGLTRRVEGCDQHGQPLSLNVVVERPLTLYLNGTEVVTLMTIGDHPELLALGFLLNQNMLAADDAVTAIEHDAELDVVVVRTRSESTYEQKLKRRIRTSGCAQGTIFADLMERFDDIRLDAAAELRSSWLHSLLQQISRQPSLYQKAGAIHGCVLCQRDRPLVYMEDVGRHNAVDKIAGYMQQQGLGGRDKIFYTTGRLTSEMVIKTVHMEIPILVSRSGFTAWGVELARRAGLTLIGRAKGQRFVVLAGGERLRYDLDLDSTASGEHDEPADGQGSRRNRGIARKR
ncbi:MAG: formate dehydrogenase accessory protein [Candidatus Accumulibacter regalis]|jgi:FdhD protein|uniref:Sulfur carrier protein FdhD n=1 Tax=Accumulibacter regalis TaxID=522306 RepID=A0A011PT97_ACCRE|nr:MULTISPECIES: formate dehydrogenase accessory sulfurtransferase FdhD [unclassified Candidatus Accumulibacter]EXI90626.1 MAG: formate dehydrogenase accessory protein [Candidatus Accumulibacter regalis]MQM35425.1 sulfurtransferase FdhD [Candidatus Accumulibacter phosphatis]MBL8366640.1 formate dehydrogenase accessory sulfurtransferase FdhD [Accumulibacter sp.]MBN8513618.1 formate dehydrogenase accessory sulfurtransferase FdhD [Accumulibacter sp.]MBO3702056.1 formate dehydrogenase accessory su